MTWLFESTSPKRTNKNVKETSDLRGVQTKFINQKYYRKYLHDVRAFGINRRRRRYPPQFSMWYYLLYHSLNIFLFRLSLIFFQRFLKKFTFFYFLLSIFFKEYTGCHNRHETHVTANNSTKNNDVFLFFSDL